MLDDLGAFVIEHFCCEERMLRARLDPRYEDHKTKHDDFILRFQALRSRFDEEGPSPAIAYTLGSNLADWLLGHFAETDRDLAPRLPVSIMAGCALYN